MPPFRHTFSEIYKLLGFRGPRDLLASAYGVKAYPLPILKIQLSATLVATVVSFCAQWIWSPPAAMLLLVFLDLANARYGYLADKHLRGQPFKWDELHRTIGKVIATLLVLAVIKNLINSYEYYAYAADVVFAWLFTYKLRKLVVKMAALKVVEGGLPKLLMGLLASKFGPYIVDSIQKKTSTLPAEPSPEPVIPNAQSAPVE